MKGLKLMIFLMVLIIISIICSDFVNSLTYTKDFGTNHYLKVWAHPNRNSEGYPTCQDTVDDNDVSQNVDSGCNRLNDQITSIEWGYLGDCGKIDLYVDSNYRGLCGTLYGPHGFINLNDNMPECDDKISSYKFETQSPDETELCCRSSNGEGRWIGAGGKNNCCNGGEDPSRFVSDSTKLCENGQIFTCNPDLKSVVKGLFVCNGSEWLNIVGQENKFGAACAYTVKGSSSANYNDIFWGSDDPAATDNRCCGDEETYSGFSEKFDSQFQTQQTSSGRDMPLPNDWKFNVWFVKTTTTCEDKSETDIMNLKDLCDAGFIWPYKIGYFISSYTLNYPFWYMQKYGSTNLFYNVMTQKQCSDYGNLITHPKILCEVYKKCIDSGENELYCGKSKLSTIDVLPKTINGYAKVENINNSLKMSAYGADFDIRKNIGKLPPGEYILTAKVKADDFSKIEGNDNRLGKINICKPDGTDCKSSNDSLYGTYDWKQITMTFTITEQAERLLMLGSNWGKSSGTIWFDNISLVKTSVSDLSILSPTQEKATAAKHQYLCNYLNNKWFWQNAQILAYNITPVGNLGYDAVSNRIKWFFCKPPENIDLNNSFSYNMILSDNNNAKGGEGLGTLSSERIEMTAAQETYTINDVIPADRFFEGITETTSTETESPKTIVSQTGNAKLTVNKKQIMSDTQNELKISGENFKGNKIGENSIKLKKGTSTYNVTNPLIESLPEFSDITITIPSLEKGTYGIEIKTNNSNNAPNTTYIFNNAIEVVGVSEPSLIETDRFICYNRADYGAVAECCGYSLSGCLNKESYDVENNPRFTARTGQELNTIQDFYGAANHLNYVARIGVPNIENKLSSYGYFTIPSNFLDGSKGYSKMDREMDLSNWSSYDNLEFDILFTSSNNLKILIFDENNTLTRNLGGMDLSKAIFSADVRDYSVSGTEKNRWHHVMIPLTSELKSKNIGVIYFLVNYSDLSKDFIEQGRNDFVFFKIGNTEYSAIYGIDKIVLTRNDNLKRFCSNAQTWIDDLDQDIIACNQGVSTKWTSTSLTPTTGIKHCCGDDQGRFNSTEQRINEVYNDDSAGCWFGNFQANNTVTTQKPITFGTQFEQNVSLLFFNDGTNSKFRSCVLNDTELASLSAYFTESNPILNNNICTNLGSWYCDFDKKWKDALIYNRSQPVNTMKNITYLVGDPDFVSSTISNASCCPESYCFNGSVNGCEAPYSNPKKPPIGKTFNQSGYRCAYGNWSWVELRYDWNHEDSGYCLKDTQCYGKDQNGLPKCFESGQFVYIDGRDHYCENGNWTSRTKFIAAQLINYTLENNINDFTLYCDEYTKTLNEFNIVYSELGPSTEANFLSNPVCPNGQCVNNFCVLKVADSYIIAGTSLNRPINATPANFLNAIGKANNSCNGLNGTKFEKCSNDNKVWYYGDKQVVLFSKNDFTINPTGFESFIFGITHPIRTIVSFVRSIFGTSVTTISAGEYVNTISDFDKLYVAVKGNKKITGVVETKYNPETEETKEFMAINYTGFAVNLCDAVVGTSIACNKTDDSAYMFSDVAEDVALWPDLTAMVRIK